MPALVSHHRFAAAALAQAQPYLTNAVTAAPMAFRWGAQGPDILYYYKPLYETHISCLAQQMHEQRAARVFSVMTAECARLNTPEATAYLLGFCCHYALDRAAQPFITYISNYRLNPLFPQLSCNALHNLCESELDRALLAQKYPGVSANYYAYMQLTADASSIHTAGALLSHTAWQVYGTRLTPNAVKTAMRSTLRTQRFLHDKTGHRTAFLGWMEHHFGAQNAITCRACPIQPLEADCVNRSHQMWINAGTPHIRCYTDYFQIFRQAQRFAAHLMDVCYDAIQTGKPLPKELFGLSFNGLPE